MPADLPFHLGRGDTGPVQQSPVTCGSAALTVARMLVNPEFARWIVSGIDPSGGPPDFRPERDRFAEHERAVMNRTNGFRAAGGQWNIPWPHPLGTPPWGAKRELEYAAAPPGAAYAMGWVRLGSSDALRDAHRDLARLVREGRPALLYIGSTRLPRHVTLVLPGHGHGLDADGLAGDGRLDVYDPATGSVTELAADRFASRTLGIAGWNVPWIIVHPRHA
ncbi:MAG: hypothetical protein ACYDC9_11595 [Dermatophilaceae bacterium]